MQIRRMRMAAAIVAASLLATACGSDESSTDDGTTQTPDGTTSNGDTDTLVVGVTEKPSGIDPAKIYEKFASDILFNTTNRLVEFAPGSTEVGPGLATEWTISEDGLTYTFMLRDGVTFHDGSTFDAEDVKYSLDRALNINHPEGAAFLIAGATAINVVDPLTVEIKLDTPNVTFLSRLNYTVASILPSEGDFYKAPDALLADGEGADDFVETGGVVGTGPYELTEFNPGESMTLERFDGYWGEPAMTKTVKVLFFESSSAMKSALENGEIDVNFNEFVPAERSSLVENADVTVATGPGARIRYLVVDTVSNTSPYSDAEVRRAVAKLVDRQRIIDDVFEGAGTPLFSMIPTGFSEYKDYISDIEVTITEPVEIDLWFPLNKYGETEVDVAETIKRSLEETGLFTVNVSSADWATEYTGAAFSDKIYPLYLLGWYPDYFDADDYIEPFYSSTGFTGLYSDADMDALIAAEQQATDLSARLSIFDDIQKKAAADMPLIPLYEEVPFAYYGPGISGVETTLDAVQQTRYWVISKS